MGVIGAVEVGFLELIWVCRSWGSATLARRFFGRANVGAENWVLRPRRR